MREETRGEGGCKSWWFPKKLCHHRFILVGMEILDKKPKARIRAKLVVTFSQNLQSENLPLLFFTTN